MDQLRKVPLVDGNGKPVDERIDAVLGRLLPRLRREFPTLQDEVVLAEILEEAARRIVAREARYGPIESLNGYAWVTVRNVATSRMRLGSARIRSRTLRSEASAVVLSLVAASDGSAEQIEQHILLRELLSQLSDEEQLVCDWKVLGFSSREIARRRGCTVNAVNLLLFHALEKIRRTMGIQSTQAQATGRSTEQRRAPSSPQTDSTREGADGETDTTS